MLSKSKNLYKKNKYYTRKKLSSYTNKPSNHVVNAKRIYDIKSLSPSSELVGKTGCSLKALHKIVNKGEGAYFLQGQDQIKQQLLGD